MSGYFVKDPEKDLELVVDWNRGYLDRCERLTGDLGWAIRPVLKADELRVVHQDHDDTCSKARFAGGVPGRIYMVTSRIETNAGRELERVILFRVAERKNT